MNPKFKEEILHNHQNLINVETSDYDYNANFKLNVQNDVSKFFLDQIAGEDGGSSVGGGTSGKMGGVLSGLKGLKLGGSTLPA